MHFARRTLTWIFDLNDANEVSRSAIMWMTNLQDLFKTVTTFCACIVLSMITKVQEDMNSFSHVYEQVLVCLSQWIILNQHGLMNCGNFAWISYVNSTCYCEIEKIFQFFRTALRSRLRPLQFLSSVSCCRRMHGVSLNDVAIPVTDRRYDTT